MIAERTKAEPITDERKSFIEGFVQTYSKKHGLSPVYFFTRMLQTKRNADLSKEPEWPENLAGLLAEGEIHMEELETFYFEAGSF